jgi:sporulation protein YlmC with PRC-barrel domain
MKNLEKTLVIVAGAAGEIGTKFIKEIISNNGNAIGVIRNTSVDIESDNFETIQCSLDKQEDIKEKFNNVDLSQYENIIYLHTIGVDKFNPRNYPNVTKMATIDPDVYDTNVNSFKYLLRYLGSKVYQLNEQGKNIKLKTVAIAGTSDKYTPFVIEDFCEAKFIIRQYIQSYISRFPDWFSGLAINLTSTITKSALIMRPFAKTDYWLTPGDVVKQSFEEFTSLGKGYKEIDLMKFSPNFVEGYYEDIDMLYTKWSAETGITV